MDARSMLRAQKAQARIEHPYASYSTSGQLRCSACAMPVPANKWDGHLLTKQHRQSVAREKAAQVKAQSKSKRPVDEIESSTIGGSSSKKAKIQTDHELSGQGKQKEVKEDDDDDDGPSLPAGFFSSGNGPNITKTGDDDQEEKEEDDDDDEIEGGSSRLAQNIGRTSIPQSSLSITNQIQPKVTGDDELDLFLASLAETESDEEQNDFGGSKTNQSIQRVSKQNETRRKAANTYKEIIPGQASYEAAPVRINPQGESEKNGDGGDEKMEDEAEESEVEKRERLKREEREEIMGRLEEEERAQEDADSRVAMLKQRMEMLKKRREGKSSASNGKSLAAKLGKKKVIPGSTGGQ